MGIADITCLQLLVTIVLLILVIIMISKLNVISEEAKKIHEILQKWDKKDK